MATGVEAIGAIALAVLMSAVGVQAVNEFQDPFAGKSGQELRQQMGISEQVYQCAEAVLEGKDADGIVAVIEKIKENNPTNQALAQCVAQDPFGWLGTENEWAMDLLDGTYDGVYTVPVIDLTKETLTIEELMKGMSN